MRRFGRMECLRLDDQQVMILANRVIRVLPGDRGLRPDVAHIREHDLPVLLRQPSLQRRPGMQEEGELLLEEHVIEPLGDDRVGTPVDQPNDVGGLHRTGLEGAPPHPVARRGRRNGSLHPLVGRWVREVLRDEAVELERELMVVAPAERPPAGLGVAAHVMAGVGHEVDAPAISHPLQPEATDPKGDRSLVAAVNDILVAALRFEWGEIADVADESTLEQG